MQLEHLNNWNRIKPLAQALVGMALLVGCGDSGSSTPTASGTDAAAAYAALSGAIQKCASTADACSTAANGDATKQAACDAAEKACDAKTTQAQANAQGKLANEAASCYHGAGHDDDAGVGHSGRDERRACVMDHAPKQPGCLDDLLNCLETKAMAGSGQNAGLMSCIADAHTCIMADMPTCGNHGGGDHGGRPTAGSGAGNPFEHAGAGGDDQSGAGRGHPEAGGGGIGTHPLPRAGIGGIANPFEHAGAGGETQHGGRAEAGAGGSENHSGPGRGGSAAGAGGSFWHP